MKVNTDPEELQKYGWTPVDRDMPDPRVPCLLLLQGGQRLVGTYIIWEGKLTWQGAAYHRFPEIVAKVVAWRELPQHPVEK